MAAPGEVTTSPKQSLENAFTIKDLNSLLKNLEAEIALNEQHLNDENDKRYMFKVCVVVSGRTLLFKLLKFPFSIRLTIADELITMTNSSAPSYRC